MTDPPTALDSADREVARLDRVAGVYDPSNPAEEFDYHTKRMHVEVIVPRLARTGSILEMGCATGELTTLMWAAVGGPYHVVEGSLRNVAAASKRVPGAVFHATLWEDFQPAEPYGDILLVCGLEHVEEPVDILRRVRTWLAQGGRLHIIVPNADSLHRRIGVAMGLLGERHELSESDQRIGHRRVYDMAMLEADVRAAGLEPEDRIGIFLKPLSNRQMLDWDPTLIAALFRVGLDHPDLCAEIYLVCRTTP